MPAHGRHFLLIYDWHGGHPCWHDKLRTTAADLAHSWPYQGKLNESTPRMKARSG